MSKGPGLYSYIGKKARELLHNDYQTDHKFRVITHFPTGVLFTTITELTPGLKAILSFKVPDPRSGQTEVQYLHDYAGI